ncbi:hypothetical protein KZZ52_15830 [Dactylosporangium sp. AC04546]|uniref:hypothetical protein n=1 Tax=Dactylosporangium sp. AC04546 TaxID=2862460 RepID=UPI001EDD243D|nr:hypothetical protein [Dactylosporangium sp. AC04546]WVK86772.1 hypothetical protein KZZ52_15830 [Dactylosporangium sp. AC04546]
MQDCAKAGASAAEIGMIPTEIVVNNEEATAIFDKQVDKKDHGRPVQQRFDVQGRRGGGPAR